MKIHLLKVTLILQFFEEFFKQFLTKSRSVCRPYIKVICLSVCVPIWITGGLLGLILCGMHWLKWFPLVPLRRPSSSVIILPLTQINLHIYEEGNIKSADTCLSELHSYKKIQTQSWIKHTWQSILAFIYMLWYKMEKDLMLLYSFTINLSLSWFQ